MDLTKIKAPIKDELLLFNQYLDKNLRSNNYLLNKILQYILKSKGKQIRPILVLLSTKLCGKVNENSFIAATLIEMLHTASLVHDDVVDNSFKRRGLFSINALWRNKLAVLSGDYLLSQGLLLAVRSNNYSLLEIVSEAVNKMSEGEILQIESSQKNILDQQVYLKIISNKTASLFAACCKAGATSANDNTAVINNAHLLGYNIGMIFQIQDDLLDITSKTLNKPTNSDFADKKITLPLIYAINSSTKKNNILKIINSKKNRKQYANEILNFIKENHGIEKTQAKIQLYEKEALEILDKFKDSETKESLKNIIYYASKRNF